ncbi:MAG: hypothetical protein AABY04_02485 [Candidatus Micrarchaeota archaeon]
MSYKIELDDSARNYANKLVKSTLIIIAKKLSQMERDDLHPRRLKGKLPIYVEECGQFRICFGIDSQKKIKSIFFIGNHKEYGRWYKSIG